MEYKALAPIAALAMNACVPHPAPAIDRFEALLAANDSATAVLEQWCRANGIGPSRDIRAVLVAGAAEQPPADLRQILQASADERIGYRHVRLMCGELVLSQAQNWYASERLTPDMNQALETTDTPFGKVAAPLGFARTRLSSNRGAGADCPAGTVLAQRALLRLPDGRPLALLVECYTGAIIPGRAD